MAGGDLSAIELCVEDWKQNQPGQQRQREQTTKVANDRRMRRETADDDRPADSCDGEMKASDSLEAPTGLELNSSAYKPDADPSSSQANNMAVAFELNL